MAAILEFDAAFMAISIPRQQWPTWKITKLGYKRRSNSPRRHQLLVLRQGLAGFVTLK
jgi:hypothetical protein